MRPKRDFDTDKTVDPATAPQTGFLIDSLLQPGMLVFDIGANVGNYVEEYLSRGCHVLAVEPQAFCVAYLRERFRGNSSVSIAPVAVSDFCKTKSLHVSTTHSLSTFEIRRSREGRFSPATPYTPYDTYSWNTVEDVTCVTLDTLVAQYGLPDFCKIDVEGHEHTALQGLTKPIPLLSFEWEREFLDSALSCVSRLNTIGKYEYNLGIDLWPEFALPAFMSIEQVLSEIHQRTPLFPDIWGDIYARLLS